MNTVLVTGAHGFIGRHTARLFGQRGWQVIGMGHGSPSFEQQENWSISVWHECDITLDTLMSYAGIPDVVVHCAGSGSVGSSLSDPLRDFQRTVATTAHIVEYVRLHAPSSRIVIPSSAAVYGNVEHMPISEQTPLRPISPYGFHKKMSEDICRFYGAHFNVSSAVVRLFSAYGEGLRKQLLWDSCVKLSKGETKFLGTGEETRDFIHVSDAVELLYVAAGHASPDCIVINGGSGSGVKINDIVSKVFSEFGGDALPEFSGDQRSGDPLHYSADIAHALSLGWKPVTDWQSGVSAYVKWYLADIAAT